MSCFITITFDLKDAINTSPHGSGVYTKIRKALEKIDFSNFYAMRNNKKKLKNLPFNTYVAEFDDDVEKSLEVVKYVKVELKKIFKEHEVTGKYFIVAGKKWARSCNTF